MERFIFSEFQLPNLKTLKIRRKVCGLITCILESYYNIENNGRGKNYLILNPAELLRFFCLLEETLCDPKPTINVVAEYKNKIILYEVKTSPFNNQPIVDLRVWMNKEDDENSKIPTRFGIRIYDEIALKEFVSIHKDVEDSLNKINKAHLLIQYAYKLIRNEYYRKGNGRETWNVKQFLNNFSKEELQSLMNSDGEDVFVNINPHCIYEYISTTCVEDLIKYIINDEQHPNSKTQ